jgi:hypothetical protein
MLRVLVVVLACSGCTPATAPRGRTVGKVMSVGGVVGLIGAAVLSRATDSPHGAGPFIGGFALVTGVGIGIYAVAELSEPGREGAETIPERNRRWAQMITEHAAGAAREGRCARVRKLEPRVRVYNRDIHDFVFMRDPEIQKCLAQQVDPLQYTPPPSPPSPPPDDTPSPQDP